MSNVVLLLPGIEIGSKSAAVACVVKVRRITGIFRAVSEPGCPVAGLNSGDSVTVPCHLLFPLLALQGPVPPPCPLLPPHLSLSPQSLVARACVPPSVPALVRAASVGAPVPVSVPARLRTFTAFGEVCRALGVTRRASLRVSPCFTMTVCSFLACVCI